MVKKTKKCCRRIPFPESKKKEQETRYYILLFRFVLFLRIVSSGSDDRRGIIPDTASTQLCVYTFINVYVYRGI